MKAGEIHCAVEAKHIFRSLYCSQSSQRAGCWPGDCSVNVAAGAAEPSQSLSRPAGEGWASTSLGRVRCGHRQRWPGLRLLQRHGASPSCGWCCSACLELAQGCRASDAEKVQQWELRLFPRDLVWFLHSVSPGRTLSQNTLQRTLRLGEGGFFWWNWFSLLFCKLPLWDCCVFTWTSYSTPEQTWYIPLNCLLSRL